MEPPTDIYAFDPALADYIVDNVAGGCSLLVICARDGVPDRATVARWLASYPDFKARYLEAREAAMEIVADDLMVWAQVGLHEDLELLRRAPTLDQLNQAHRTRIAVQQWLMAKWSPKLYGGRIAAGDRRDAATDASPSAAAERDPDAPPRLSPRPFLVAPLPAGKPITIPGLAVPQIGDLEPDLDDMDPEPATGTPAPRPSRRERRAIAAMQRKRPPNLAAHSRAPPA